MTEAADTNEVTKITDEPRDEVAEENPEKVVPHGLEDRSDTSRPQWIETRSIQEI